METINAKRIWEIFQIIDKIDEDGKNEYNAFKLKSQRFILGEVAEQDKGETNIEDEQ